MAPDRPSERDRSFIVQPGEGRAYPSGGMQAAFLADEDETGAQYSISEWRLDPGASGPGPHSHAANDDVFFVLEGVITFLVDDDWRPVPAGGFVRVARGTTHDYRNDTAALASMLNLFIPGGFERQMPAIVAWFAENEPDGADSSAD